MPIRFRCSHCNQLMGIARRKAGTNVLCPTCQRSVLVPMSDNEPAAQSFLPPPLSGKAPPLFERSDFEAFLDNPVVGSSPPPPPPPSVQPSAQPSMAMESLSAPSLPSFTMPRPSRQPGLVLSPTQATWLTVAVILFLALAFGIGLLIGHEMK